MYWRAMTTVDAREALLKLKVSAFPHIKENDRDQFHRQMHDLAFPPEPKQMTKEMLRNFLNGK